MTKMIYCTKNNSKTLPFTVNQPYNAEYQGGWVLQDLRRRYDAHFGAD